jgi:hypothetical protein
MGEMEEEMEIGCRGRGGGVGGGGKSIPDVLPNPPNSLAPSNPPPQHHPPPPAPALHSPSFPDPATFRLAHVASFSTSPSKPSSLPLVLARLIARRRPTVGRARQLVAVPAAVVLFARCAFPESQTRALREVLWERGGGAPPLRRTKTPLPPPLPRHAARPFRVPAIPARTAPVRSCGLDRRAKSAPQT